MAKDPTLEEVAQRSHTVHNSDDYVYAKIENPPITGSPGPLFDAGYAAGVEETEKKYKSFLDAARVHQHRNMETGEVYPIGTYLEYCPQCQALRQLEEGKP